MKGEGQRRDFRSPTCTVSEMAVMRGPFGSVIMTRINFKVKIMFYSEIGGHVLTPNFDTCQGVLQRRKGSVWYDRWTWRGDRASPLKILLTEEGEVDQIFWLRFGRRYLVLEIVLFSRLESCFVVIG